MNSDAMKRYPINIPARKCQLGRRSRHNIHSHVVGHVMKLDAYLTMPERAGLKSQAMYVEAGSLYEAK